mgnify:CR=1 FL=1
MADTNCKLLLTNILRDNYRNIICAKSIDGEITQHGETYLDPKYDKNPKVSDIREVTISKSFLLTKILRQNKLSYEKNTYFFYN